MFSKTSVACLVLGLLVTTGARAQDEPEPQAERETASDFARRGPYLGVAGALQLLVNAKQDFEESLGPPVFAGDTTVDTDILGGSSLGMHARVGYRFHENFAAELHYEWLASSEYSANFAGNPGVSAARAQLEITGWTLTADAKGYPLTGELQPYGLIGLGFSHIDTFETLDVRLAGFERSFSSDSFAIRLGGGAELYLTPNVLLQIGATYVILPTQTTFNYVSTSVGIGYRF
jgi:opacity protein-like surface antigen